MKWYKSGEKTPRDQTFAILCVSSERQGQPVEFNYNKMVYTFYKLGIYHDGYWRDPYLSLCAIKSNLEDMFNINGWCEVSLFSEVKGIEDSIEDRFELLDL